MTNTIKQFCLFQSECIKEHTTCVSVGQCNTECTVINLNPILIRSVICITITELSTMEHNPLMCNSTNRLHVILHCKVYIGSTYTIQCIILQTFYNCILNSITETAACTELTEYKSVFIRQCNLLIKTFQNITHLNDMSTVGNLRNNCKTCNLPQCQTIQFVLNSHVENILVIQPYFNK